HAEKLQEIVMAAEDQRSLFDANRERHSDAISDVFFEARRPAEPLGRMNDLREAVSARVEPCPDLSAGCHVFGDGDDARNMRIAAGWKWPPDQPYGLRQPMAEQAHARLQDLADIDDRVSVGEPLAETVADRRRKFGPGLIRKQRAKAQISERRTVIIVRAKVARGWKRSHCTPLESLCLRLFSFSEREQLDNSRAEPDQGSERRLWHGLHLRVPAIHRFHEVQEVLQPP